MTGQQIYENFHGARGPEGLQAAAKDLRNVFDAYTQRASRISELANSMEEGWTGNAAGAAQRGAAPLSEAHDYAGAVLAGNSYSLEDQSQKFFDVKQKLVLVPDPPQEPPTWLQVITLGGAKTDYEQKVAQSNAASQANVAVMAEWTEASSYNTQALSSDYGSIVSDSRKVNLETWPPGHIEPVKIETKNIKNTKDGKTGGDGKTGVTGKDEAHPKDKPILGLINGKHKPGEIKQLPRDLVNRPVDNGLGHSKPGRKPSDGSTRPEDYRPDRPETRPGQPIGGLGTSGGGGQSGQGSFGGTGFGPLSGGGSSSGSGAGRLGGGTSGMGGEKSLSGNRGLGTSSGAAEAMGRGAGAKGAGGRPGAGGMPGMAPGQKGQGDEDDEHQRKYVVEDDDVFQLTDGGERLTDPRTGLPLTPPVIGE